MRRALAGSAAAHAAVAALCLLTVGSRAPDMVPPIEVELVQQAPMQQGAAASDTAPPPAPDPPAPAAAEAPPLPPPPPPQAAADRPAGAPSINLGDGPRDLEGLSVIGDNVVPPAPDALFRNKPPVYPAAAARQGAEGVVQLLVRVSAAGAPEEVRVAGSSGHSSLDRAARDAVLLWHFRPARVDGAAVPFDYVLNIRFTLGER